MALQHCIQCGAAFGADFGLSVGAAAALTGLGLAVLGLAGWVLRAQLAQLRRALKTNAKIMLGLGQVSPSLARHCSEVML
jgi:hypothetical protein